MHKLTTLVALMLLAPAITHAKSLDELLVERGVTSNKGEAQSAAGVGMSKTYYSDGTRFEFPDTGFTSQINTLIRTRYEFTDNDTGAENVSSFSVDQARIGVSGTALHNEFSYVLEGDFAGQNAFLTDAYITWAPCDNVWARMGQWKTPISRQYGTSDAKLQFVDRSSASDNFTVGRNQSLSAGTSFMDGKLGASVGIWNGLSTGEGNNSAGVDTDHAYHVGVRWNPVGQMDVAEEGDINWTEDTAVSVGVAYLNSSANDTTGVSSTSVDTDIVNVDANLKYEGWSVHSEFFWSSVDTDGSSDSVEPIGFYVQAGYFVTPKKLELAARYGYVDPDNASDYDKQNQATLGVNYYFWSHHLKAQLNYDYLQNKDSGGSSEDVSTNRWIFGVTGWF